MAGHIRSPIWLPAAPTPGVGTFAILFFIESFARASVSTVIPLQAYDLFGNEQAVSFLYTAVGIGALGSSFFIPLLIRAFARRWVYTIGALALVAAAVTLALSTQAGQAGGMFARVFGTACLNVTLNLYIMDFIAKRDLVRNDALRMTFATLGWTIGPTLGVWLYKIYGPWASYGWSAGWAVALIAVFWYFRLSDNVAIQPARQLPANPLWSIGHFVAQPRLRLAWLIAFGRSAYWQTLFVYGPILMVASGQGALAGGILVSLGNITLLTTLVWSRIAQKVGVRKVTSLCFLGMALGAFGAGLSGQILPLVAAGALLCGTVFAAGLDTVGGVAFYRAVKPRERAAMTSVYRTYYDFSDMLPPFIYGVLLGFFGLDAVFFALAVLMAGCMVLVWRHLPRAL